jgi:hypothetical protein
MKNAFMKQMGLATPIHVNECVDIMLFDRGGRTQGRGAPSLSVRELVQSKPLVELLLPYVENNIIFLCPADSQPGPSLDYNGEFTNDQTDSSRTFMAVDRHALNMNCFFFDDHAK